MSDNATAPVVFGPQTDFAVVVHTFLVTKQMLVGFLACLIYEFSKCSFHDPYYYQRTHMPSSNNNGSECSSFEQYEMEPRLILLQVNFFWSRRWTISKAMFYLVRATSDSIPSIETNTRLQNRFDSLLVMAIAVARGLTVFEGCLTEY